MIVAVLVTVILWQNFSQFIPSLNNEVIAYNVPSKMVHCDERCLMIQWLELRTNEIMLENGASFRRESRYQAQLELNEMIIEL